MYIFPDGRDFHELVLKKQYNSEINKEIGIYLAKYQSHLEGQSEDLSKIKFLSRDGPKVLF